MRPPDNNCGPGSGHHDCRDVLERMFLFIDHEMADADCVEIQAHLDACRGCLEEFGLEQVVKQLVARSCGKDRAPQRLRERVLLEIRTVQVQITSRTVTTTDESLTGRSDLGRSNVGRPNTLGTDPRFGA